MYKLFVFDLDGTLAPPGGGMPAENVARLRRLEQTGARVALCSGKPTYYLCGFMRQVGLETPVLVGENGAVIQFGVDLPPRTYIVAPYSQAARRSIRLLREAFDEALPGVWYQPNETGLTPFARCEADLDVMQGCIDRLRLQLRDVDVYRHRDCFDITPTGISKRSGVERLGALLGVSAGETVAAGDGVNDYPMFDYAGLAVGVRVGDPRRVARNFDSTGEMLDFLLALQNA